MLYFQFPNNSKSEYGQDIISISSESEGEGDDAEYEMEETPLSDSEYDTINCLPDPDEPGRSVGFNQNVEVRFYPVANKGTKPVKKTIKSKLEKIESTKERIARLQDVVNKSDTNERKANAAKNKIKMLKDRSYRVVKLNQEMEEALHAHEEPPPLIDYSEQQQLEEQKIINQEYLIKSEAGGFVRKSILDKDVHPPPPCKTMATRFCEYCKVDIDLHVWEQHIRTVYHILQGRILRHLQFRCWRGKRYEEPHAWMNCSTCKKRMNEMSDDGPVYHN